MNYLTYDNNEHQIVEYEKNTQNIKKVVRQDTMVKVGTLT